MKFLCVPCDSPMTLQGVSAPDPGSLSVVYSCPECGYEIAMLTNAYETQIVQSLGVRFGPDSQADGATAKGDRTSGTGCPFAAMIPPTDGERVPTSDEARPGHASEPVRWTAAAEARLERIPPFVRPMARAGIERFARENGSQEVDEKILDAARDFFGM